MIIPDGIVDVLLGSIVALNGWQLAEIARLKTGVAVLKVKLDTLIAKKCNQ